jgi:plastocyanin
MHRSLVLLSTAALAGVLLGGCGDRDSDAAAGNIGGGTSEAVEVVARDIEFGDDTYDATAGTVEVRYVNEGSIAHTLLVDDVDGFKLEVTSSGDQDQSTVELEPGTYTLYCDIPGHRDAGMEATLEVS